MTFDEYLTKFYGFNTLDGKWKRMSTQGKTLLKSSYKQDMAKETKKETKDKDEIKLAKLYPSNKE